MRGLMVHLSNKYDTMHSGIIKQGLEYLEQHSEIQSFVLGVSGGVDSALVAALAWEIAYMCPRPIRVIGFSLPSASNKDDEVTRANQVGEAFCHEFFLKPIDHVANFMFSAIEPDLLVTTSPVDEVPQSYKIRAGNIKARIRMMQLYDAAGANRGLVLSTDNFTEFNLGFWTLHGDVGDLGFIQELWKTEVYGLAEWLAGRKMTPNRKKALMDCVNAKPTDGLGVSNSDIDQLLPDFKGTDWREAYKIIDNILIDRLGEEHSWPADHPVYRRHENTAFKRANPISFKRDFLLWPYNTGV